MTETATGPAALLPERSETKTHPFIRPRDAATLIIVDRAHAKPKVLVGKRHDKVVFEPNAFVFPGGRVDTQDVRAPAAAEMPDDLLARLTEGSPRTSPARARALAISAIRETCEETGLCIGRKITAPAPKLPHGLQPFADVGLLPDLSQLFLIARAITPPGQVRRYDTRFFATDASAIAHRIPGVTHADAELVELLWVEIDAKPLEAMHIMTVKVLQQLQKRLATGPLRHDAPVPFFRFREGQMGVEMLPGKA